MSIYSLPWRVLKDGQTVGWRAMCECNWVGPTRLTWVQARDDCHEHQLNHEYGIAPNDLDWENAEVRP